MSILSEIIGRSDWSPRTKEEYLLCVGRWEAFAGPDPSRWNALAVEAWRDQLRQDGLQPGTVNKHLYALRYAARRYEVLGHGPDFARGAEALRGAYGRPGRPRRALSVDEVQAIVSACRAVPGPRGARDAAIVVLAVRTGLRASALCRLDWSGLSGNVVVVKEKGDRVAGAVLDDEALAELGDWATTLGAIGASATGRIFRGIYQQRIDNSWKLRPSMSRQSLHRAIAERARDAGIRRPVHAHLFRHTFVSWALESGVPPERVMAATGHRSLATLSRYFTDLQAESDPVANYLPRIR